MIFGTHNYVNTGDVLGQQTTITQSGLLKSINQAREQNNLSELRINPQLNQASYAKAMDMFDKQYWAHVSPTGVQPWKWISDAHYNYDHAGENLAKGFNDNTAVVAAWLASPEHRANLLGTYQDVGFAVVGGELQGKNTILVVSMYAMPALEGAAVAGANIGSVFNTAEPSGGVLAVIGEKVQALPAAAIGSVVIVLFAAFLSLVAHAYRGKLPKDLRRTWYVHHGVYKAIGLVSLSIVVVLMYSGGQI